MKGVVPRLIYSCIPIVLFIVVGAVGLAFTEYRRDGPLRDDVSVVFPVGASASQIAHQLADSGIINDRYLFTVGVRLQGYSRMLKAGEYRLRAGISMGGVAELLVSGKTIMRRLTVPEGLTTIEIVNLLLQTEGLIGPIHPIPEEGSFLPETYHFSYGDRRSDIALRMQRALVDILAKAWNKRDKNLPFNDPHQALILASIVEKETSIPDERAHIAGVFVNRLRRGMFLQSDPTVVYGLTLGKVPLDRPLTQADTREVSVYNTYVIAGLPPGPIGNPGLAAIRAVMHPLVTDDIYFVANGTGGHSFAPTFKEHVRNVARWRQVRDSTE